VSHQQQLLADLVMIKAMALSNFSHDSVQIKVWVSLCFELVRKMKRSH